ncbi:peptidyl-prolyl cis-trans isomerase [Myxococcus stipitatus DSM 14675]|uniref:peptidylprolyl isomerase n=1 Tax=Myxococcus stipitatus (strain DSM 14675 / JCM 12634 / Mx s8) TaxID=1278073 RepID=L7UEF2_MYXSD|nr:peptidylprolyl isomerase [Myxococcus stipitatus]AGC46413.1 peptidyl-prolyl cis-trans isomerase [Myxococcus stipitatus DSM 14675]
MRRPILRGLSLSLLVLVSGCAHTGRGSDTAPPDPEVMSRIQDWEDLRSLGDGQLVSLATGAPDSRVRARALRALARIQDVATLDAVVAGLRHEEPRVRGEAAFAVGELALSWEPLTDAERGRLTGPLLEAEAVERDAQVHVTQLDALGRLATPDAFARLVERMQGSEVEVAGRAALSLGVAARRGGAAVVKDVPLAPALALMASDRPVAARYGGAYLVATAKRAEALPSLRRCLTDEDADLRALCAKALGDVGGPEDAVVLGALLNDAVPRVAAEAARALAKLAATCSGPCVPLEVLKTLSTRVARVAEGKETPLPVGSAPREATRARSAEGHPLLALAQQGLPDFGAPVLESLRSAIADPRLRGQASEVALADLGWLDCRLAAALDRQRGELAEVLRCGWARVSEERSLSLGLREVALSRNKAPAEFAEKYLSHSSARVRLTAMEVLAERPTPRTAAMVAELLRSEDAVVAGSAASTLGQLKDPSTLPGVRALADRVPAEPDLAAPVAGALVALEGAAAEPRMRQWLLHPHANVRRVAATALTEVTGKPVRSERVALPRDTFRPEAAPHGAGLVLRTDKGDITVRLDAEDAPLTSGNLYGLARKGYFNGITFHRVVPDFVAQGGDPRGDGEGGPGYSIRCEMTRRPYLRGVLGMALSGKDTGGSQFFFTHAPQPHLDGRYTVFGEVVSGMDTVDALLEGDVIREVTAVTLP